MTDYPFEEDGGRAYLGRATGVILALLLHGAAAYGIATLKPIERAKEVWVEMTMTEPEPEAEPEPLPEQPPPPEPQRRKQPVDFEDTVEEPPPESAPDPTPPDRPVRMVQGLSASSFAPGSGTGLAVRAGTSLRTGAGDDTMGLDEAIVPFSAATVQPKVRSKPALVVPDSVADAKVQGVISVLVDIDERGRVVSVTVQQGLHPDADRACVDAWRQAVFRPAMQEDEPVGVRGVPYRCRIEGVQ